MLRWLGQVVRPVESVEVEAVALCTRERCKRCNDANQYDKVAEASRQFRKENLTMTALNSEGMYEADASRTETDRYSTVLQ